MKVGWKAALGIAVTALCLYLAFKDLDFHEALDKARRANFALLLLSAAVATTMFPLRAIRWRVILDPVVPKIPIGPLWRSIAVGMMVNNIALFRAGELARAFAITREVPAVSFSTSLASLVVDRVFDAIVVLLLLAVSILVGGFPMSTKIGDYSIAHVALLFAAVPFVMLIVLYALVFFPATLIRIFELFARRVSPVVEQRGAEMLRKFADGLSVLRSPGHFVAVFFWTLVHWLVQPLAFWLALKAFSIDVPWSATLFVQGVIVILVAAPALPGFFGVFEFGARLALGLYGVSDSDATTWGLVFHVASFIPITLIGAYYSARLGFKMSDVRDATEKKDGPG